MRVILRNAFSSWASYLVSAAVGFLVAPVVVHGLGNTGYGLWTLVLSLTGYFGLLDLGIRSSVGRFVVRHLALNDEEKVNRTVSTACAILSAGGALALIATLVVLKFFFSSFKIDPGYESAGRMAMLITGINISCILPLGVFSAVLIALERYDITSGVAIVSELLRAALVVTAVKLGYGLVALALISVLITALQYSALAIFAKGLYRPLKLRFAFIDATTLRDLFGFGIYRFIWIVANQLIFYSDSVVIGIFLGASSITFFAIAGSLINYGRSIVSLLTDTLVPTAARLDAKQDLAGLQKLLIMGTRMALIVSLPTCLGLMFLGKQFIVLWMGAPYAGAAVFLVVLTIPQFGSMSQYVSALILAGMAKHKVLAYLVFAEGAANLLLSIFLVKRIGLIGVAWGTVIPALICSTLVVPAYTLRILKVSVRDYLVGAYLRPLICGIPVAAVSYAFSVLIDHPTWTVFGAEVAVICGLFGLLALYFCIDAQQRASLMETIGSLRRRRAIAHGA